MAIVIVIFDYAQSSWYLLMLMHFDMDKVVFDDVVDSFPLQIVVIDQ